MAVLSNEKMTHHKLWIVLIYALVHLKRSLCIECTKWFQSGWEGGVTTQSQFLLLKNSVFEKGNLSQFPLGAASSSQLAYSSLWMFSSNVYFVAFGIFIVYPDQLEMKIKNLRWNSWWLLSQSKPHLSHTNKFDVSYDQLSSGCLNYAYL